MKTTGRVVLHDATAGGWLSFESPFRILETRRVAEVLPLLREIEGAVEREGVCAAGFLAYEAAPAFDPAHRVIGGGSFPLAWFGLFSSPSTISPPRAAHSCTLDAWHPSIDLQAYSRVVDRIKDLIRAGDTYQVDYTFRLRSRLTGDPWDLFCRLAQAQRSSFSAYVETEDLAICSASPELFFRLDGDRLESRPMKGTAPRGLWSDDDRRCREELGSSEKDRAENVMIVDMVRNDIGRVAKPGSVSVPALFSLERYPTVWQMTSTVEGRTDRSLVDILAALFPPASITGAPKIRTMEIIAEIEETPRRIYTGTIGYLAPGRKALFNVAIRTALVDPPSGRAEYGVGSGIVWASSARKEYDECLQKARVLEEEPSDVALFETMLWRPDEGFFLRRRHLERLSASAEYFGYGYSESAVQERLDEVARGFPRTPGKVHLLLGPDGSVRIEWKGEVPPDPGRPLRVAIAAHPVRRENPFLYHKTTDRRVYERAAALHPDSDDVILWNEAGEVTESTIANVVADLGGDLVTPPIECGLLGGTFRASLIEEGKIRERRITLDDLRQAKEVCLVNSVRQWRKVRLVT